MADHELAEGLGGVRVEHLSHELGELAAPGLSTVICVSYTCARAGSTLRLYRWITRTDVTFAMTPTTFGTIR